MSSLIKFSHNDLILFRKEAHKYIRSEKLKVLERRWKSRAITNRLYPKSINPKSEDYWKLVDEVEKYCVNKEKNQSEYVYV